MPLYRLPPKAGPLSLNALSLQPARKAKIVCWQLDTTKKAELNSTFHKFSTLPLREGRSGEAQRSRIGEGYAVASSCRRLPQKAQAIFYP
jgi:hypothetical protein